MTVEQLIELLQREYPQALVFVEEPPCRPPASFFYPDELRRREITRVYTRRNDPRVRIRIDRHGC